MADYAIAAWQVRGDAASHGVMREAARAIAAFPGISRRATRHILEMMMRHDMKMLMAEMHHQGRRLRIAARLSLDTEAGTDAHTVI